MRDGEEKGDEQDNTGNTATADKQVDVETIGSLGQREHHMLWIASLAGRMLLPVGRTVRAA